MAGERCSMTVDLERIEELHQADMQASKKGDHRTLRGLMSDDAVVLPPGGRMIRGREALDQSFADHGRCRGHQRSVGIPL
jgi:ketosteroid isomerase-like protein